MHLDSQISTFLDIEIHIIYLSSLKTYANFLIHLKLTQKPNMVGLQIY